MHSSSFNKNLILLVSVFFFWGFVASANTILIPVFKEHFHLRQWQSQLVDFAFYIAYFVGSLAYYFISQRNDFLQQWGYKKGLIIGLLISAFGTLLFIPAAMQESFPLLLTGLFIVAFGFSLQQIVANPFVIALGHPNTGAIRINLAGGLNSLGTTIGPLLISYALFGNISTTYLPFQLTNVILPYLLLGFCFVAFASLLHYSPLPNTIHQEETSATYFNLFEFPQLYLGMLAIFAYVGTEVTIQSNLPEMIKHLPGWNLHHTQSVHFISLYWGSLMIGRWLGAIPVFQLKKWQQKVAEWVVPFIAFALIMWVNKLKGYPVYDFYAYVPFIFTLIVIYSFAHYDPSRTLLLFGISGAVMQITAILLNNSASVYLFISGGLFCSVLWPCIFSLALWNMGSYSTRASSLLIMMILGGALLPPLQGYLADITSIRISYLIPTLGFLYLAYYGYRMKTLIARSSK